MFRTFRKIGILTSGGDAPGMNAAVRAVTRAALSCGVEVMGIYRGYSGLIDGDVKPLGLRDVSNILNRGGTILYSDRCPAFKTEEGMKKAVDTCRRLDIDGIVAIGGDGTFRGATDLTLRGVPCVGLPGTIDNDITSTDETIGFDTALNTVLDMVDRLRDTCESHARCNVVEVMGHHAGDIALQSALAVGATAAVIPEIPFSQDELYEKIRRNRKLGKRNFIVIVSEGMGPDYAPQLTQQIQQNTGVESKFARLAHVVRGGQPTLRDRVLATMMGEAAVDALFDGKSNLVVCLRHSGIVLTDISYALALDRMYKGLLSPGELDAFSPEHIAEMKKTCDERRAAMQKMYDALNRLGL
ncbi:MAG: 6-phosphofructokinase [Clostridia bacterium]|nr:6-phosphofructokinase [Clostridia bacterium]